MGLKLGGGANFEFKVKNLGSMALQSTSKYIGQKEFAVSY